MKPYVCTLTSEGVSVLMAPLAKIDLGFSGDEILVSGGLK